MTEKTPPPAASTQKEAQPQAVIDATPTSETLKADEEGTLASLREMQENVGQMSELAKEEESLVKEFFDFLLRILKPLSKTLEIPVSSLPKNYRGQVNKAYLYLTGQLVLVCNSGEVEILNLADQENHGILIEITSDVMMKLKMIIDSCKSETEKRVKFLMSVTKELQKVAKVFTGE